MKMSLPGPVGVDGPYLVKLIEDELHKEFPEWPLFGSCQGLMLEKMKSHLEPFNGEFMLVFNGIVEQDIKPLNWAPHQLSDPTLCRPFSELYGTPQGVFPKQEIDGVGLTWLIGVLKDLYPGQVMRAPYYSSSQLAAFYIQNLIGSIYGDVGMLLFPKVDHVYTYDREAAGPVIKEKTKPTNRIESLTQLVCPVFVMLVNGKDSLEPYYDVDDEARRLVTEGYTDLAQHEVHSTFGELLPPFIHAAVSAGFFPHDIGMSIVMHILDNYHFVLHFDELKKIHDMIIPLRAQIVYQSLTLLPEDLSSYELVYKNSTPDNVTIEAVINPQKISLDEWNIKTIKKDLNTNTLSPNDWLANLEYMCTKGEKSSKVPVPWYPSEDIYIYATCLKSIDLMGYFTHSTNTDENDVSGTSVFADALYRCKDDSPNIHTAALLFIESVRTGHLHGEARIVDEEYTPMSEPKLLAARIMSLVPLRTTTAKWEGPFNIQIFAYNQIVCFIYTALRTLVEVVATTTLSQEIRIMDPKRPWNSSRFDLLRSKLICKDPPCPFMGFVFLHLLNTPLDQISWDFISSSFPNATHLKEDINEALKFLIKSREMICILATDNCGQTDVDVKHFKELEYIQNELLEPIAKKLGLEIPPMSDLRECNEFFF